MPKSVFTDAHQIVIDTLISARKKAGMLQAELGAAVGKDQTFISNIERGQRRVDVLEFYALAIAMKTDPAGLYRELTARLPGRVDI
jgi:transcriptional regulator with XRE-family HTH domain